MTMDCKCCLIRQDSRTCSDPCYAGTEASLAVLCLQIGVGNSAGGALRSTCFKLAAGSLSFPCTGQCKLEGVLPAIPAPLCPSSGAIS